MVDPLKAALDLIARGVPVFPCDARPLPDGSISKAPLVVNGFLDASTDPTQIKSWWTQWGGNILWGVPTGHRTGIEVLDVDIDPAKGVDGRESIKASGRFPPKTLTHMTPRGGYHLIYKLSPGESGPSDAGKLGPGLDRRGDGGYIIWYPAHGGTVVIGGEPAAAPDWLTLPVNTGKDAIRIIDADRAEVLLGDLMRDAREAMEGERNATLSRSAFLLGQLLQAGFFVVDAEKLARDLIIAGQACGLEMRECERVVGKGVARGADNPGFEDKAAAMWRAFGEPVQWLPRGLLEDLRDLTDRPSPAMWLIRGIMEQGTHGMMHGRPNAGKSFVLIDWALSIACGVEWQGRDCLRGPVVYVCGEGQRGFRRRVKAWCVASGLAPERGWFRVTRKAVAMNDGIKFEQLCAEIDAGPRPVLIVVDTKARATPGWDENTPVDSGRYIELVERLQARYACAVLTVHHTGKGGGGALGHSSLLGAVDNEWQVSGAGSGPPFKECVLSVTKLKDGEAAGPMRFAFTDVDLPWFDDRGERQKAAVLVRVVEAAGDGPKAKTGWEALTDNDRRFLGSMGTSGPGEVGDDPVAYRTVRDAFIQAYGKDGDGGRKAWDRALLKARKREWITETGDLLTPNVFAIKRDVDTRTDT